MPEPILTTAQFAWLAYVGVPILAACVAVYRCLMEGLR